MKTFFKALIVPAAFSFLFVACDNNKHAGDTDKDNVTVDTTNGTTGTYSSDDDGDFEASRKALRDDWNRRLDEIDRELNELDAKIESEKGESKEAWKQRKQELKQESSELRSRLDRAGDTTEDKWESFKNEMEEDFEQLGNSIENFFEDDKSDNKKNK